MRCFRIVSLLCHIWVQKRAQTIRGDTQCWFLRNTQSCCLRSQGGWIWNSWRKTGMLLIVHRPESGTFYLQICRGDFCVFLRWTDRTKFHFKHQIAETRLRQSKCVFLCFAFVVFLSTWDSCCFETGFWQNACDLLEILIDMIDYRSFCSEQHALIGVNVMDRWLIEESES